MYELKYFRADARCLVSMHHGARIFRLSTKLVIILLRRSFRLPMAYHLLYFVDLAFVYSLFFNKFIP